MSISGRYLAAFALGFAAACGGSTESGVVACDASTPCPSGLACQQGVCVANEGGANGGTGGGAAGSGGSDAPCVPTAAECYLAGPDGPGHECLAKHDNTGQSTWTGRFSQITVIKPTRLSNEFVQISIIDQGISLNQPQCFEAGDATFVWIFSLDSTTSKMRTGGGLPIVTPADGTCFVNIPGTALPIAPIDVDITLTGSSFSATGIHLNVPIFLPGQGSNNPTILPLHEVELQASFTDETHNCVGKYNGETLSSVNSCQPDTKATPPERGWTDGGTLEGYITIAEADQVYVEQLGSTLCVFLAGVEWSGTDKSCATSEKWIAGERPDADWCAATNAPADAACKDAYRLEGEFAASAFKVNGDCP